MLSGLFKRKPRQSEWMRGLVFAEKLHLNDGYTAQYIKDLVFDNPFYIHPDFYNGYYAYINHLENQNATT